MSKRERIPVHPLAVRVFHWINALAIVLMIMSGWRIYNASPLFSFRFPNEITLGGWLAGALQWHFAAMWLLTINLLVYLAIGLFTRHFRRSFFPVSPRSILQDLGKALRGQLPHETGRYNAVQKASYIGVLLAIIVTIVSGVSIWKPVQLQELAWLMGGYEGARLVHFAGMTAICAFIVVHLALVLLVPSTLLPMIIGWARKPTVETRTGGHGS
ncbi:MAG TPA: cytochrome b/b6 domain-containing protein [Aestuariivirga sp.]|nr:cytochrome b/b6 domain-containing protein [Aestuariivirga sp.]